MSEHTPLPWSFDGDWYRIPTIFGSDGRKVASIEKDARERTPEREANVRLMLKAVNNHDEALEIIEALLGLELGSSERALAFLGRVGSLPGDK